MIRILGVDPGSMRHAWAVLDTDGRKPARYVAHGMAEDVDALVGFFRTWIRNPSIGNPEGSYVEALAIESATELHNMGHKGILRSVGVSLMAQQGHVGELRRAAKDSGTPFGELTANEWRLQVVGIGSPSDARVKQAMLRLVRGIPKNGVNAHHRDAMGVALAAVGRIERAVVRARSVEASR